MHAKRLLAGTAVEAEHGGTYRMLQAYVEQHKKLPPAELVYASIAADHLRERDDYYERLQEAGL